MSRYFPSYLALINVIALIVCVWDKRAAVRGRRRIRERTLFALALIGGAVGMYVGMLAARHKTLKRRFTVLIPIIIVVQAAALVLLMA